MTTDGHKISLAQQIEEIDAAIESFPRQVRQEKIRESVAEFRTQRLKAIKETLEWLAENEVAVRESAAARKGTFG